LIRKFKEFYHTIDINTLNRYKQKSMRPCAAIEREFQGSPGSSKSLPSLHIASIKYLLDNSDGSRAAEGAWSMGKARVSGVSPRCSCALISRDVPFLNRRLGEGKNCQRSPRQLFIPFPPRQRRRHFGSVRCAISPNSIARGAWSSQRC